MDDRGGLPCAWTAVRSIGEAITRTNSNDIKDKKIFVRRKIWSWGI